MRVLLSLFRGIGLADRAFELEWPESCIVCGPDTIWGGDVRGFHAPAGVFDGVFGGPPCQQFSPLANIARARGQKVSENLIPEFERVVSEAQPAWFLMENVTGAPLPRVPGYIVRDYLLNNRWVGGVQNRLRRFSFGTKDGRELRIEEQILEPAEYCNAVVARGTVWNPEKQRPEGCRTARGFADACIAQGLPADFLADAPFTIDGKWRVVGNGVPLPMGRAIARAVKRAMEPAS